MSMIKLNLEIGMPHSGMTKAPKDVETQVREMLEHIESGFDSSVEWATLHRLYKALKCHKNCASPRFQNLIEMIKPVLSKYGYYDVTKVD